MGFAFSALEAHKIVGMCNARNIASIAVMESVGMRQEAAFRDEIYWHGQWVDQLCYAMLEREYGAMNNM